MRLKLDEQRHTLRESCHHETHTPIKSTYTPRAYRVHRSGAESNRRAQGAHNRLQSCHLNYEYYEHDFHFRLE